MTEPDWEQLQTLFEQARGVAEHERPAFLDTACAGDAALRAEIEALLHADALNARETQAMPMMPSIAVVDALQAGAIVDGWRIVERIGVGGMGSVFLAQRANGDFEQQAALKVIKRGMDTESVIQRFRQERQILARLNHPNIARLIDGGVTDDGRPFFAMEYIDGLPITEYCDRHCLTLAKRLELFQEVCNAVHDAHKNLVVHRDLKPSNIIVTADGSLKLLDFGIAKMLDDDSDQHLTRTGMQLHTPAYAAPEQLLNETITTATDVYALGAILYELLSGRRPFEARRSATELRDLVIGGDPAKPSTAVTQVSIDTNGRNKDATAEEIGARRGARIERLRKLLLGDLDTICLMALRREPQLRYASAEQMSSDIRRHLGGLPVVARADSLRYRIGKFYRRHRSSVVTTIGVVTAFIALSIFYTARLAEERDIALDEQSKANEVVDFVTGLFAVSDPSESRGEDISARQLLDAGASRIENELTDRPGVQGLMRRVLGEVYYSLGSSEQAEQLLTDALAQQRETYGDNNLEVATSKMVLGFLFQDRGEYDTAETLLTEAYDTRVGLLGGDHREVMEATSVLAFFEETRGDYTKAERLHKASLQMGHRLFSDDSEFLSEAMTNLGGLYRIIDRNDDAEPLLRDALAMQNRLYDGSPHPEIDDTKRQLAGLLRNTRRFEESEVLYLEIIESRERILGPDHVELANTWNSYSQLLSDMGRMQQATEANSVFIAIMERAFDGPHPSLGAAYNNLATLQIDSGDFKSASKNYQLAIDMQNTIDLPARHVNRSYPLAGLARIHFREGRFAKAEAIFRDMLELRRENFAEDHVLVTDMKSSLGAALTGLDRFDEAESLLLESYELYRQARGEYDPRTGRCARWLAEFYEKTGDAETAAIYRAIFERENNSNNP